MQGINALVLLTKAKASVLATVAQCNAASKNIFKRFDMCKINQKLLLLITVLISTLLTNCKKGVPDQQANDDAALTEKFFKLPANIKPEVKRVYDYFKENNNKKEFVTQFVKNEGIPLWEKAQVQQIPNYDDDNNTTTESYVAIPVIMNAETVNGLLNVKVTENLVIPIFMRAKDYAFFEGDNIGLLSAKNLAKLFMSLESDIYNHNNFILTDPLLKYANVQLSATEKPAITFDGVSAKEGEYYNGGYGDQPDDGCKHIAPSKILPNGDEVQAGPWETVWCPPGVNWGVYYSALYGVMGASSPGGWWGWQIGSSGGGTSTTTGSNTTTSSSSNTDPCTNSTAYPMLFVNPCGTGGSTGWTIIPEPATVNSTNVWNLFSEDEKDYVNQNPAFKAELENWMWQNGNYDEASIAATHTTLFAILYNGGLTGLNGPYNQQFFDDIVKPNLPSSLQGVSANEFFMNFDDASAAITQLNPSSSVYIQFALTINENIKSLKDNRPNASDPTHQKIDIVKLLNCFSTISDIGASYKIQLSVDIPKNGDATVLATGIVKENVGHTFITLTKTGANGTSISQTFGFYPQHGIRNAVSLGTVPCASYIVNDGNIAHEHEYNASMTKDNISASEFATLISTATNQSKLDYNMTDYNCTSYALDIYNSILSPPNKIVSTPRVYNLTIPGGAPLPILFVASPAGLYQSFQSFSAQQVQQNQLQINVLNTATSSKGECN